MRRRRRLAYCGSTSRICFPCLDPSGPPNAWARNSKSHRMLCGEAGRIDRHRRGGQPETNMSLDNTSHPGRPGPDELVPSRYALRVGEIDVMVVSDGVITLPGAMLAHNADPAVRAA